MAGARGLPAGRGHARLLPAGQSAGCGERGRGYSQSEELFRVAYTCRALLRLFLLTTGGCFRYVFGSSRLATDRLDPKARGRGQLWKKGSFVPDSNVALDIRGATDPRQRTRIKDTRYRCIVGFACYLLVNQASEDKSRKVARCTDAVSTRFIAALPAPRSISLCFAFTCSSTKSHPLLSTKIY